MNTICIFVTLVFKFENMKELFFGFLILSATSVFGQNRTQINGQNNEGQCSEVIIDTSKSLFGNLQPSELTDDYSISQVTIEGNCLVFDVVFDGGCGITNFKLVTDGLVMESIPQQIRFLLVLQDEDTCKAMVYRTIKFDISKFSGYKLGGGLILRILNSEFIVEWPE